jgi:hypothetical protein
MQIRCSACSKMVEAPSDWDGRSFACPACGGDVCAAGAPAPEGLDASAAGAPKGIKLTRTPEGRTRIEYRWRNPPLLLVQVLVSLGSFGYVTYVWLQRYAQGGGSDRSIWIVVAGALVFLLFGWLFVRNTFGWRALEFDATGITQCFRLPPLPERRKDYHAEDITALLVTTFEHAKPGDRSPRWLQLEMGAKAKVLANGLPVPHLEWMYRQIRAVIKSDQKETQS